MESIFQASLKNNRIYFVFILDVAINSTDLKAESYCITCMENIHITKKKKKKQPQTPLTKYF